MKLAIVLGLTTLISASFAHRFVCYYGSWSVYRHGPGKYRVEDIDPTLCTHLIYSFVGLSHDGKVNILDHYNDIGDEWHEGAYKKLQKLREINPNLKILMAIGGWNEGSTKYSRVVNDPHLRKVFVKSILEFTREHKFDGFDLDWEYPNQRGGVPSDREAFSSLIAEIKEVFKPYGLILSAAVSANAINCPGSYNCKDLVRYLDFINIMTYDLHGSWETVVGHHTAMYPHSRDPQHEKHLNVDAAIKYWVKCTGAPEKLNIGLASYGRTFTLADSRKHEIGSTSTGPGPAGSYVGENGFLGYNEVCKEMKQGLWKVYNVIEQDVKYAVKGRIWCGFDDMETITKKLEYAKSLNLGGAMIWSIETDDFRGECGFGNYPLLRTVNKVLKLPPAPGVNVTRPPQSSTTSLPTTITSAKPTPPPTTTTRPTTVTTPRPTPPPGEDFSRLCQFVGHIFKHPNDITAFFICTYSGVGLELKAVYMKCPDNLVFDETQLVCNYRLIKEKHW